MPAKAPKGGIASHVNGQFYEGGQFIPDHGKYCGKGRNRVTQAVFDEVASRVSEKGYTLVYEEKWDRFAVCYPNGTNLWSAKNLKNLLIPSTPFGMKPEPKMPSSVNPW